MQWLRSKSSLESFWRPSLRSERDDDADSQARRQLPPVRQNYYVLEDGVVGRIFTVLIAPQDRHWMWASGHNGDIRRAPHGYEPTREAAMVAFAAFTSTLETCRQ